MNKLKLLFFSLLVFCTHHVHALPFFDIALSTLRNPEPSAYLISTEEPQELTFINSGVASLKKRLDLIANAQHSIDLEFFIYNTDQAGRLVTQALIRKAQKGVRVRLLIDYSLPILQLDKYFTTELQKQGIEVRYYNKTLMLNLYGAQFRSHRKLILVDGAQPEKAVAITGGRNIADEYFDLGNKFNFRDSDVVIKGSLVQSIRKSFELFWNSEVVSDTPVIHPPRSIVDKVGYPEKLRFLKTHLFEADEITYERKSALAKDYVTENNHDKIYRELIDNKGAKALAKEAKGICRDTTFVADYPSSGPHRNMIFEQITKEFSNARSSVQIESPYLIVKSDGARLFQKLRRQGASLQILTNSLYSTDASYTTAALFPRLDLMTSLGAKIWLYTGLYPFNLDPVVPSTREHTARWGLHSKRAIIDEQTIIVGTFNADPRSKNLNAEMAIICRNNPELGKGQAADFNRRLEQSVELDRNGRPVDGRPFLFSVDWLKTLEFILLIPFSNILDFLL